MSQNSPESAFDKRFSYKNESNESFKMKFFEESDCHKKARELYSFTLSYLSHDKSDEHGSDFAVFIQLLSEIPSLCETFLIATSPHDESANASGDKTENLECTCLCFDIVQKCLEIFSALKNELIITKIALNILLLGYTHCKNSEIIYGNLLEQFASHVGRFFKKIETLQMVVLQKLDQINAMKYFEDESHIISIMKEMGNLCQLVSDLDANFAVDLWNMYNKIIYNHENLKHNLDIYSVLICFASKNLEMLQLLKHNLDHCNDEDLSNNFEFYLIAFSNMLNYVQDDLSGNIFQFKTLIINLLEFLISCFASFVLENDNLNLIKRILTKRTYSLISNLYSKEEFMELFITEQNSSETEQSQTAILLSKLCALQYLDRMSVEQKQQFLLNIFPCSPNKALDTNLLCLKLPVCVLTDIDSDEFINLYCFAYKQITEFLKCVPDFVIANLNTKLLHISLVSSDTISLLLYDTWIYRLRCSDIEFFKNQLHSALQLYSSTKISQANVKFDNYIKRMLTFIPHTDKEMFSEKLKLTIFHENDKEMQHRYGVPNLSSSDNELLVSCDKNISKMMCQFKKCDDNDVLQLIQKACLCLELCASFVGASACSDILQFLEFATQIFKSNVYEVQIAVLTFVKALSRKQLAEHTTDFGRIIICIANLFSEAIHCKNYIVRLEGLNTFSYFAKCTPHVRFVQETVRKDPLLKLYVKSYVSAIPDGGFLTEKEKYEYLKKLMAMSYDSKFNIPENSKHSLQQTLLKQ